MGETRTATSEDGWRIAYDVTGGGPPVILLHGFSNDRHQTWHEFGVVEALADSFTVITMDLRGCGESEASGDPARYTVDAHRADVLAVADACGLDRFALWGWSFGGTLGLELAAVSDRITRAVIAGTRFGTIFTLEYLRPQIEFWEHIAMLRAQERMDELDPEQRVYLETLDPHVMLARWHALSRWPAVEPSDLHPFTLVISGTDDHPVVDALREQQAAIKRAMVRLHIFDGLDQVGLLRETATVLPVVQPFLAGDVRPDMPDRMWTSEESR